MDGYFQHLLDITMPVSSRRNKSIMAASVPTVGDIPFKTYTPPCTWKYACVLLTSGGRIDLLKELEKRGDQKKAKTHAAYACGVWLVFGIQKKVPVIG